MPVWHEATKAWRKAGRLEVIGITQEQHPDRCRLFAQWKGLDWPILWDPFNLTGSAVVPRFLLIDEHGIVRSLRANPKTIEAEFLDRTFEKPAGDPSIPGEPLERVVQLDGKWEKSLRANAWRGISELLWRKNGDTPRALASIERVADADPALRFCLGVAHRLRYDSPGREAGDFQAAIDGWAAALAKNPRQYIWRRRIQQYGPRLDKPYPFYGWVDEATRRVSARGEEPVALVAPLTSSERAGRGTEADPAERPEPDPKRAIASGPDPVRMESAVAPNTGQGERRVCVHLLLRPKPGAQVAWDLEAGAPVVWIGGRLHEAVALDRLEEDGGVRFELELPDDGKPLAGYALYYACLEGGACRYLRHDFTVGR